jgi:hypothetical protein
VRSTVEDSVKKQFKSYSDTVQENVMVCKPKSDSVSPGTLKEVINRPVAKEDDKRSNVIILGEQEQEPENLRECVKDVFDEIMVRPEIREISEVRGKSSGTSIRPIKVKVAAYPQRV